MGQLTRKELEQKDEQRIEKVELGDGNFVYVKEMMGTDRSAFEALMVREVKGKKGDSEYETDISDFSAKLAVCCLCDEQGNSLYRPEEYKEFGKKRNFRTLRKIVDKARELNAIGEDEVETLAKNLKGAQGGASTSASAKS